MNFKILRSVDALDKNFINSLSSDPHWAYEWFKTIENIMKARLVLRNGLLRRKSGGFIPWLLTKGHLRAF